MAIKSHHLGPGQLTIGETGTSTEFGLAARSAQLIPEADDGDIITVLSGDELADGGDETWTLEGTILQSYDADSLILFCFDNSGKTLPFTFRPNNDAVLEASGDVLVRSISVGGDVKTRNTSDFKFKATNVQLKAGA